MKKPVKQKSKQKPIDTHRDSDPNYDQECDLCGEKPTVGETGLCGPCCFGEADTAGGNW